MDRLARVTTASLKQDVPAFKAGDQLRVWYRIQEKGRTRQASFEGTVLRVRGSGISKSVTVRRVTQGEGVERVFPLHAPVVERFEVVRRGLVRRARLYYLRTKIGKTRIENAGPDAQGAEHTAESPEPPTT